MKRIIPLLLLSALFAGACSQYDDAKIWEELKSHASRIEKLESAQNSMNTNITALQALVSAIQNNIYITSVVPVLQNGKEIGYTINFSSGNPVTILHGTEGQDGQDGAAPVIGVKADTDGLYYWTLDGAWLTDAQGKKILAQGSDGVTPQLRINESTDFWEVSYDAGKTWKSLGIKASSGQGDGIFHSVSVNGDSVTFILNDGTSFTMPLGSGSAVTDLSINGTANCYIVSKAGEYCFTPTMGNSSEVPDIDNALTLWESFGTAIAPNTGDLISNIKYENGKISFTASGKKGNAVILGTKGARHSLKRVWTWHIWLTDTPEDQVYLETEDTGIVMDRNLGATSTGAAGTGTLGLLYQYGRKDPFMGPDQGNWNTGKFAATSSPNAWYSVTSNATTGTIEYANENPTYFIKANSLNNDWYYTGTSRDGDYGSGNSRWCGKSDTKTTADPCPPGYMVAGGTYGGLWQIALGWPGDNDTALGFFIKEKFGIDFGNKTSNKYRLTEEAYCWYPAAGKIDTDGTLKDAINGGYYWGNYADALSFSGQDIWLYKSEAKAQAFSVRCMRDK